MLSMLRQLGARFLTAVLLLSAVISASPAICATCDELFVSKLENTSSLARPSIPDVRSVQGRALPSAVWVTPEMQKIFGKYGPNDEFYGPTLWKNPKQGLLNQAAMIASESAVRSKLFLGRDGSWQYFATQILGYSASNSLIFVSRDVTYWSAKEAGNQRMLTAYLRSAGLDDQALIFDTAFNGSIISFIKQLFPAENLVGRLHLANRGNPYVSSRVFLSAFDTQAIDEPAGLLSGLRFTVSVQALLPTFWSPVTHLLDPSRPLPVSDSSTRDLDGGTVNPDLALLFLQDLKYEFSKAESQRSYQSQKQIWSELNQLRRENRDWKLRWKLSRLKRSGNAVDRAIEATFQDLNGNAGQANR